MVIQKLLLTEDGDLFTDVNTLLNSKYIKK